MASRTGHSRFGNQRKMKEAASVGGLPFMAFPTKTISVIPAKVFIDHALAGRTDRNERHFLVACRTKREKRRDAL